MKKIMKLSFLFLFVTGFLVVSAQCADKSLTCCPENAQSVSVEVYYFHTSRRCETCLAVEDVTRKALQEFYGDKIVFKSLNLEDEANNEIAKTLEVTGQTLLIVSGENKTNLTNFAFMNARTKPEKLKEKLKETINSVI